MTIAVLCAAGVGSVGGGLIALQVSPESPSTQPAAPSIDSAAATQPTPPRPTIVAQPITPPDPQTAVVEQIQSVLFHVPEWARTHPGAPCPDVAALGIVTIDPWGHRIELTCTDQPADQVMGAISAGPDGIPGNRDDVKSWNLGPTVTQFVQGPRWIPAANTPAASAATRPASGKRHKDSASPIDRISRFPRTGSGKPPSNPRSEAAPTAAATGPIAPATAPATPGPAPTTTTLPSPSAKPSIAPTQPTDAADGIPTRR